MANSFYDNIILENMFKSVLSTKLDLQSFVTVDNLAPEDGLVKRINRYTVSGNVQDLSIGVGNSSDVEVGFVSNDYTVKTTQGRFSYHDEEAVKDSYAIESGIKGLAETMVNDFTSKAIAEWRECSMQVESTWTYANVVDALALLNTEDESEYFMLIGKGAEAGFRKALKDDLKYVEANVRTGYIGSVCGIPVYTTKALNKEAFIASKEAVRLFLQPATEIEQDRDVNTRKNYVYARKLSVVALVDDTKVVHLAPDATTDATITTYTKAQKTIAGAATTGAKVEIYIDGKFVGSAVAASSAYTFTNADNLTAGQVIKVRAIIKDEITTEATATVAA